MPYLSRIRLNPLRDKGREFLRNPQLVHAAVLGGIAEDPVHERVLWRLDAQDSRRPGLLVLTASRPDWTHIVEQAGWPGAEGEHAVVRDYTPVLDKVALGREFSFRLTANPVQSRRKPDKLTKAQSERLGGSAQPSRSFRLGHRTVRHQLDWFLHRTDRWGFTVPAARTDASAPGLAAGATEDQQPRDMRIVTRARQNFGKKASPGRVAMQTVTYEGRLVVTDPALLRDKLLAGIGPGKAYGCGLLTLAPAQGFSVG